MITRRPRCPYPLVRLRVAPEFRYLVNAVIVRWVLALGAWWDSGRRQVCVAFGGRNTSKGPSVHAAACDNLLAIDAAADAVLIAHVCGAAPSGHSAGAVRTATPCNTASSRNTMSGDRGSFGTATAGRRIAWYFKVALAMAALNISMMAANLRLCSRVDCIELLFITFSAKLPGAGGADVLLVYIKLQLSSKLNGASSFSLHFYANQSKLFKLLCFETRRENTRHNHPPSSFALDRQRRRLAVMFAPSLMILYHA